MGEVAEPMRSCVLGYRATQVVTYVRAILADEGQAPSYGMIRDTCGFEHNGHVHRVVVSLERRGILSRTGRGRVRRISLVDEIGNYPKA